MAQITPPSADADVALVRTAALVCRMHEPGSPAADRAARDLYQRFGPLSWSIARRMLGDDELAREVVQDAMLAVWRTSHSFDPQRGTPVAWVARIVRSRAIDARRHASASRRSAETSTLDEAAAASSEADDVEHAFLATERTETLARALAELPAEQRVLIELSFLQGYTQIELSEMLKLPLGTVKARILRGLARLRPTLEPLHGVDSSRSEGDQS